VALLGFGKEQVGLKAIVGSLCKLKALFCLTACFFVLFEDEQEVGFMEEWLGVAWRQATSAIERAFGGLDFAQSQSDLSFEAPGHCIFVVNGKQAARLLKRVFQFTLFEEFVGFFEKSHYIFIHFGLCHRRWSPKNQKKVRNGERVSTTLCPECQALIFLDNENNPLFVGAFGGTLSV
jgi:hypothetical protein